MLPNSTAEIEATVSGAIGDLLGAVYRKVGRVTVATGPALISQWPTASITDATISGLAVFVNRVNRYLVEDLHDQPAVAGEWQLYLVQYRGSAHLDEATRRLLQAFPLSRAVPLGDLDEDGNTLGQVSLTVRGAMT